MITALVMGGNYHGVNATRNTEAEAIEDCMAQIRRRADPKVNEIVTGFWTPVGVLPARNIWLRRTHPEPNQQMANGLVLG